MASVLSTVRSLCRRTVIGLVRAFPGNDRWFYLVLIASFVFALVVGEFGAAVWIFCSFIWYRNYCTVLEHNEKLQQIAMELMETNYNQEQLIETMKKSAARTAEAINFSLGKH